MSTASALPVDFELDGNALPPFASEENKQLDAEVKRKEADLERVEEKIESDSKRIKVLTDHLVNVQQELVNTQQLVDAKKHESETEEHLKALTNRQLGRIKAEIVRLQKLQDDTQDRVNSYSNELMRGNEKLDQFKLEMNWNQEQLEQWAIAARQKEEDELTLEKYKRADDAKVRELTLSIEKMTVENDRKKKELADQVTETQARQIEMDKTAELFRQLHEDRKKLIMQWEESVNSMKTRDRQLERLGEEYAANLTRKRAKEERMREKRKQHEEAEQENQRLEQSIQQTDRQLVRLRLDHMDVKGSLTGFKDEVEVLKNQLSACETEKTNTRNQHAQLLKSLEMRKDKFENMQKSAKDKQRGLEDAVLMSKDKEAKTKEVEQARTDMLNQQKNVEKEMKAAKESLYKESQELYRLRAEEANTLGEISGSQSAIKNLQFQISRLDQERQRQQELLYAVDFQSQLMQRKVARVSGERTVEEREEFNEKVEQLEKQLEEQKNLHGILSAQLKRQDAELKNAGRTLTNVKKDTEQMKGAMEELELQNSIVNRTVQQTVKEKEESLIQHDILRLEVKRLRQALNAKSENLYSLENRKQQKGMRRVALALLFTAASLVAVRLVWRETCGWQASYEEGADFPDDTVQSSTPSDSLREQRLGLRLPVQLPAVVTKYIDAVQFPTHCDQDTPATVWHAWSWGGPGLGAHFIHWSWTFGVSMAMRRTYVARDPDTVFGYNEGGCIHSLFCALHPISSCTEAEVDGTSAAAQQARLDGWVYSFYGARKALSLSPERNVRADPARIFDSEDYWTEAHYRDPTVSCRVTMWVPPQFRSVGSDHEWNNLRSSCNFSAFDALPQGRRRASQDLLWWRSMVVGYFFQPLPSVLQRATAKMQRIGLTAGEPCISLHVRRGDKVSDGGQNSETLHHPLAEYMQQAEKLAEAGQHTLYLASDDLAALMTEWDSAPYSKHWRLLVDREELPWSVGFNIGRPKRSDEFEETLAAAWAFSSCPFMVGSLESYFYKLALHLGVARGIYKNASNLFGAEYEIGVMAVPRKKWFNFMP